MAFGLIIWAIEVFIQYYASCWLSIARCSDDAFHPLAGSALDAGTRP